MDVAFEKQGNLTTTTVSGVLDADGIVDTIRRFYDGEPTDLVLWDLSRAEFDELSSEDVHRIARTTTMYADRRPQGRTALVFSEDVGFGLGRMFGSLQEVSDSPVRHRSFRSLEEAMAWLGE
jgi:hypothetical protein